MLASNVIAHVVKTLKGLSKWKDNWWLQYVRVPINLMVSSFVNQRSVFTKMNVWIQYLYWTGEYPTGPDDPRCSKFKDPDSEAEHVPITINHEASGDIES